ncbi:hypothetical protein FRX31_033231 [Thalictrum thalictroides]|uniref:Secreted protein n=1 Tax=Thalictrum thalictroides TaxID=46969 RepID=A0A7J6UYC4_THATH|nr:hypothetical protein FRX31_033231 [Thalictrum thalictroides]
MTGTCTVMTTTCLLVGGTLGDHQHFKVHSDKQAVHGGHPHLVVVAGGVPRVLHRAASFHFHRQGSFHFCTFVEHGDEYSSSP